MRLIRQQVYHALHSSLLTSLLPFIVVVLLLFTGAWLLNHVLNMPTEGIDRLYALTPLAIWCVAKARTMLA